MTKSDSRKGLLARIIRKPQAQRPFDFYEDRGQAENYIKELKNQIRADRTGVPAEGPDRAQ